MKTSGNIVEIENLRDIYKEIATETDIETAIAIHKLFGGQQISFPKKLYSSNYVNSYIRKNYNGRNIRELARQFGLSERRVRQILRKPK
ncbi:MAG: Mor transcription activator family protein [Porcipelethomonas sp.]